MDKRVKELWIAALRGGQYQQGREALRTVDTDGTPRDCCLGVLCDLYHIEHSTTSEWRDDGGFILKTEADEVESEHYEVLPPEVMTWAGLDQVDPALGNAAASGHNDGTASVPAKTFAEIAELIEQYL